MNQTSEFQNNDKNNNKKDPEFVCDLPLRAVRSFV